MVKPIKKGKDPPDKAYIAMRKIPHDVIQKGQKETKKVIYEGFTYLKFAFNAQKNKFEMFKNQI